MRSQRLTFTNPDGLELAARLDLPVSGSAAAYALFAHCFTCSKNLKAVTHISRALTLRNIGVLRFDFTGLGESEGDFADTNFSSNVADLVEAANFMARELAAPAILIGHSLGGAAVLQAAQQIPDAKAVVTIGAPCTPQHVAHLLEDQREEIEEKGEVVVKLAGREFRIRKQFLDDLEERRMTDTIADLKKALLVMHSPFDNTVGIDNAAHIYKTARHPKSFVSLDQADHLMTNENDSLYAGAVIAAWAMNYVCDLQKNSPDFSSLRGSGDAVVAQTGRELYFTEINAKGHPLIADEPESANGKNRGPSPYDLLGASLAACKTITVRMYADRKEWPLDDVTVTIRHRKAKVEEVEEATTEKGRVDLFDVEVDLDGDLSDEQRERLLEIAGRCPVHKTLHSEVVFRSRLSG